MLPDQVAHDEAIFMRSAALHSPVPDMLDVP
jgi:hypothetical protein